MTVEVRLPTILRPHVGGSPTVSGEGKTVGELFDGLVARYPGLKGQLVTESGDLHKFVNVYRNDEDVRYIDKLDTRVKDDDVISILPAVAGG